MLLEAPKPHGAKVRLEDLFLDHRGKCGNAIETYFV